MFYKPKNDPRVTPVGRVLRRYSLDELPQLFNVLLGDMSLVGPRPQIDAEVAQYDRTAHRRLLRQAGPDRAVAGLRAVRASSPEDGIRLDVSYVENWTLFGDLMILARTARAIVRGDGAATRNLGAARRAAPSVDDPPAARGEPTGSPAPGGVDGVGRGDSTG